MRIARAWLYWLGLLFGIQSSKIERARRDRKSKAFIGYLNLPRVDHSQIFSLDNDPVISLIKILNADPRHT